MNLELGQRIYDKGREKFGTVVLRRVGDDFQFLEGYEDNQDLINQRMWLDDDCERMFVADDGMFHYIWTEDEEVEEVND